MIELEKPSAILRREAEKPVPNWMRGLLYIEMPTNGHTETCRCQLAILQDYLIERGVLDNAADKENAAMAAVASAYGCGYGIFAEAVVLNDKLRDEDAEMVRAAFKWGIPLASPEVYHAYQTIAPRKLREVAEHYERHGL